ncbi:MAG: transposase [candidate division Zixibacteria bacterium]|nr:transposase [candidate division Zixibacteria bacterium]
MTWPHSPPHWLFAPGIYMVTAGTYRRLPHLSTSERRDFFLTALISCAEEFGWFLQAWSVLPNHYHFVAMSPDNPGSLRRMLGKLHMTTAKQLNIWDNQPGRKVWFQYWDTRITFERSYLARLNYVHFNPIKHGMAENAEDYPWCSAAWFFKTAPGDVIETVQRSKSDQIQVPDEY